METTNNHKDNKKTGSKIGGLLFTGCLFLGMAAGWYWGNLTIGIFAGMGIGFVLMAVVIASYSNRQ